MYGTVSEAIFPALQEPASLLMSNVANIHSQLATPSSAMLYNRHTITHKPATYCAIMLCSMHEAAYVLTTVLVAIYAQEVDAITSNTDKAQGPVFRPSRSDYQDTFTLGAKDSKTRTQYDTGALTHAAPHHTALHHREELPLERKSCTGSARHQHCMAAASACAGWGLSVCCGAERVECAYSISCACVSPQGPR
jgi:hypothetical protein